LSLKLLHHNHTKNLRGRILLLKERISSLDCKGKNLLLLEDEVEELHGLAAKLFSLCRINTIIWRGSESERKKKYCCLKLILKKCMILLMRKV